jgi:hypothetical protein
MGSIATCGRSAMASSSLQVLSQDGLASGSRQIAEMRLRCYAGASLPGGC